MYTRVFKIKRPLNMRSRTIQQVIAHREQLVPGLTGASARFLQRNLRTAMKKKKGVKAVKSIRKNAMAAKIQKAFRRRVNFHVPYIDRNNTVPTHLLRVRRAPMIDMREVRKVRRPDYYWARRRNGSNDYRDY